MRLAAHPVIDVGQLAPAGGITGTVPRGRHFVKMLPTTSAIFPAPSFRITSGRLQNDRARNDFALAFVFDQSPPQAVRDGNTKFR